MQERLHIDEVKRVEKMVNSLIKSWQKLNKEYAKLQEKHLALEEELHGLRMTHDNEVARLQLQQEEAQQAATIALDEAVKGENQRWQEKYNQLCLQHEEKIREMRDTHQHTMTKLRGQMDEQERALKQELAQMKKVKEVLCNRVLGEEA